MVGAVTFSQPIGYLEKGHDFDGTLGDSESAMDYFAVVGMIPVLDLWFDKNPVKHAGPPGFNTITGISLRHLVDRYQGNDTDYHDPEKPDFLDRFIEAKQANPKEVDDAEIASWLMINMIAGADTTATTLRSAFHYSFRDKRIWKRLQEEALTAGLHKKMPVATVTLTPFRMSKPWFVRHYVFCQEFRCRWSDMFRREAITCPMAVCCRRGVSSE